VTFSVFFILPVIIGQTHGVNKTDGFIRLLNDLDDHSNFPLGMKGKKLGFVNGFDTITDFAVSIGSTTAVVVFVDDVVVIIVVVRGVDVVSNNTEFVASHASPFDDLVRQSSTLHVLAGQ
jgi:hypothetical protein